MLTQWEFQLPTQVRFGRGMLKKLGEAAAPLGRRAMLVGYRDRAALEPAYGQAVESLTAAGLEVVEFFEVTPDPPIALIEDGTRRAQEAGVDLLVGLGGGSAIDAAKGIAALSAMGGSLWDYTDANRRSRSVDRSLPVVAVPTTAGTGSEVSSVAVFTYPDAGSQPDHPLKAAILGPAVAPQAALVDPDLAMGSPPELTAACGADALGHAIESCMSRRSSPVASLLGTEAARLILTHLPRAIAAPDDPAPREALALAATLAGTAFSTSGVTLTHAIAAALGSVLGIPHGVAVALGTPINLRYNAERSQEVYARLADACAIPGPTPAARAEAFIEQVIDTLRQVGLPDRVEVPPDAPANLPTRLARSAVETSPIPLLLNPTRIKEPGLVEIFEELLRG